MLGDGVGDDLIHVDADAFEGGAHGSIIGDWDDGTRLKDKCGGVMGERCERYWQCDVLRGPSRTKDALRMTA
jgi:hypothetical protein